MRVAVTGATGFIGRALCARLAADGDQITALVRSRSDAIQGATQVFSISVVATAQDWQTALSGCDAVVHLAARTHQGERSDQQTRDQFWQTNVDFTRALVEHSSTMGIERFVFMSSSKVMGERSKQIGPKEWQAFSGDSPPEPVGPYGESKLAAERLFARACGSAKRLTILRPPLVYGPQVGGNLLRLLHAIDRGIPLPFRSIVNLRSLVSREHLIDAILLALKSSYAGMRTYTLADCALSTPQLIEMMAHGLKRPTRLWACPVAVLRAVGRGLGAHAAVARLTDSLVLDVTAIERELRWRPTLDAERVWAEIGQWYRSTH